MLKPTFNDFINSNIVQPDIWIDHWTIPFVTSFAFSGVADLASSTSLPVPLFMFVLPGQRTTEVVVFSHRSHAMEVKAFLEFKNISAHPGLSLTADILAFCEQFMFDATNHWFIRPSVWNSFCAPKKDQVELRTSAPTNNLWSSVSEVIFLLDRQNALSIGVEI